MSKLITRGARLAAAAALAGAAAFGTAQATDWDKLQGDGWSEEANGNGQASMGEVAADANAATDWGAEISTAFQGLGMEPARAECYGNILTEKLSPAQQEEAAQLVSAATNGQDVRMAVMDSGPTMVGGFSAADASCPEGAGG
ncbi:MAG TPA: hypothetical protein VFJ13_08725 [Paracoccaceae bacterium]|nr:hypothetical protein [Paracoccaceae bacterium]